VDTEEVEAEDNKEVALETSPKPAETSKWVGVLEATSANTPTTCPWRRCKWEAGAAPRTAAGEVTTTASKETTTTTALEEEEEEEDLVTSCTD
jgi:hypothetical protein